MDKPNERPNLGQDRPRENGVPDLSDLMNQKREVPQNDQVVDLSSLMNEIRRVPTVGAPTSLNAPAPKEAPKTSPAAAVNREAHRAAVNPAQKEVQKAAAPIAHKETQNSSAPAAHKEPQRPGAAAHKNVQRTESAQPRRVPESGAQHRTSTPTRRLRDPKLEAKRRRVSIILATTFILLILAIVMGIVYAVTHWPSKSKNTTVATTTTMPVTTEPTTVSEEPETTTTETTLPEATPTPAVTPFPAGGPTLAGYCVVIDPGHQAVANTDPEVMSSDMGGSKDKSAQGYVGTVSGTDESEINLQTALLLKEYLESLGCEVYLTRETNDVDISNKERAEFAVSHDPDVFIRLYCNAANDSKTSGCEVIVPASGKYASSLPGWGETLGKTIEAQTGSAFNGCKASSKYSGLNWADSVPSFMIRMGYLSNSDDEAKLLDAEYQYKECKAIAEFIATMAKH